MNDACQVKVLNGVEVQENGIIRNNKGRIIARLVDSVDFDSEHLEQTKSLSDEEIISMFDHPDDFNCIDFARAIEKRHGIKTPNGWDNAFNKAQEK